MKISVVTATYNSVSTVGDTLKSVQMQDYGNVEHVVVDGLSSDGTLDLLKRNEELISWISEEDSGLYDAINKGIRMASGDIVGILNSDDFYPHRKVLSRIAAEFENPEVDAVIGDIAFVKPENLKKIVRHYSSAGFHPKKFAAGYMPAHPSFYVRRKFYEAYGLYKTDYKIAADYELLIRFMYVKHLRFRYIPDTLVYMRTGGVSNQSLLSRYVLNKEIIRACAENGIRTNMARLTMKYFNKVFEYIKPALKKQR